MRQSVIAAIRKRDSFDQTCFSKQYKQERMGWMEKGVRKGGEKERSAEREGGLRRKDKRTPYAAVIWDEYKTGERERTHVQCSHLHTVFVCLQKCLTAVGIQKKKGLNAAEPIRHCDVSGGERCVCVEESLQIQL